MKATHEAMNTKVCPSCHATLFADMDICYGCLYDFNRVSQAPLLVCPEQLDVPHEDVPYEAELQPPLEAYMGGSAEEDSPQSTAQASLPTNPQTTSQDGPQNTVQQSTAQASPQSAAQQTTTAVSLQPQAPCCSQAHDNCKLIEVGDAQVIVIVRANN